MAETYIVWVENFNDDIFPIAYRRRENNYSIHVGAMGIAMDAWSWSKDELIPIPMGANLEEIVKQIHKDEEVDRATIDAGCFYPRIWRPEIQPKDTDYEKVCISSIEQMDSILSYLEEVFQFVHPSIENSSTYGGKIRHLLLLAATEVETQWKGILKANKSLSQDRFFTTRDYVKLCQPLKLPEYCVALSRFPDLGNIRPFKCWNSQSPTTSLFWYDAYNKVKHDRESNLNLANIQNMISAVAAIPVLLAAQFGSKAFEYYGTKKTFQILKEPGWGVPDCYFRPIGKEPWEAIPYNFET